METAASTQTNDYFQPPEVLIEFQSAKGDLNKIAEIVGHHPQLAKEVLATINAPYFRLVREIKSAEEAVRMLGINRVVNLATGRLLRTTVFSGNKSILTELWATSLKVAVIGVLISKELDKASTDEVYTTSLFHNAGMAILTQSDNNYPKLIKEAYFTEDSDISNFEISNLEQSHASIGAQMASNWGLSGDISKAIKLHHSPNEILKHIDSGSELGELLLILKISEHITRLPGYLTKCPHDHEWEKIKEGIYDHLELTEGMFKRFELVIKKQLSEIKS